MNIFSFRGLGVEGGAGAGAAAVVAAGGNPAVGLGGIGGVGGLPGLGGLSVGIATAAGLPPDGGMFIEEKILFNFF